MSSAPLLIDLASHPERSAEYEALVGAHFPAGHPPSRPLPPREEFPLLLASNEASQRLALLEGDRLVATTAYRLFEFPGQLRVAALGLVVTHPDFRGRGHAAKLLAEGESRARAQGAALAALWSDLLNFYTKQGYLVGGTELQWTLDAEGYSLLRARLRAEVPATTSYRVRPLANFDEIAALGEGLGPRRESRHYDAFIALADTELFVAEDASGRAKAWAFRGKGRDLRDTLHEIRGATSAVAPLLAHFAKTGEALRVQVPAASPLREELTHWLGAPERGPLAFFKVLSTAKLLDWVARERLLGASLRLRALEGEGFEMGDDRRTIFRSTDPGHLIQLLMGPWRPDELEGLPPEIGQALSQAPLPLPLYFWGLDSV